jgi:hypothetical protein
MNFTSWQQKLHSRCASDWLLAFVLNVSLAKKFCDDYMRRVYEDDNVTGNMFQGFRCERTTCVFKELFRHFGVSSTVEHSLIRNLPLRLHS